MNPVVSIILPTYNRARFLPRCIRSVLAQTFEDFELLIIDDASTDETSEVVAKFQDPRIRYHRLETNQRQCRARNIAIQMAEGEFIAFQDSDDLWLPERLSSQLEQMRVHDDSLGLVFGAAICVGPKAAAQVLPPVERLREPVHAPELARELTFPFLMQSWLVRRAVFDKVGEFDPAFHVHDDWDMTARIVREYKVLAVPEPCCVVFQTEGSLTSDSTRFTPEICDYIMEKYLGYLGSNRENKGAILFLLAVMNLRSGHFWWGRREIWRSLMLAPRRVSTWMHAVLSLAGESTYRRVYLALQRRRGWLF